MSELITVPTVNFEQGDVFDGYGNCERPIQIQYHHGNICLEQCGNEIVIHEDYLNKLFSTIKKHLPEAIKYLSK